MQRNQTFTKKIKSICSEIDLASHWKTPIIIVVLYTNEHVLHDARDQLSNEYQTSQQNFVHIQLDRENPNLVPLLKNNDPTQTVFSVTGFEDAGGKDQADAYRFLNLHREHFILSNIRILLWLKPDEFQKMALYAPDFWAFRHIVLDFSENRATPKRSAKFRGIPIEKFPWQIHHDQPENALNYRLETLAEFPSTNETLAFRLELHGEIAGLYFAQGKIPEARQILNKALQMVPDGYFGEYKSKVLLGMAVIFIKDEMPLQAEALIQQAIQYAEPTPAHYIAHAQACQLSNRNSEALNLVQKALRQTSEDAAAWNEVGNIHANLGHFEDSLDAYQKALTITKHPIIQVNQAALLLSAGREQDAALSLQGLNRQTLEMISPISGTPVYQLLEAICN